MENGYQAFIESVITMYLILSIAAYSELFHSKQSAWAEFIHSYIK